MSASPTASNCGGNPRGISAAAAAATATVAAAAAARQTSPYSIPSYYGQQAAAAAAGYQDYGGMYHHANVDAWHHAAYAPLGHLYRGYEAAAAAAMEWPHPPHPHSHHASAAGHHSDLGVDPLSNIGGGDAGYGAGMNSECDNGQQRLDGGGGGGSPGQEYKLFNGRDSHHQQQQHQQLQQQQIGEDGTGLQSSTLGTVTHSSPDSGLAASDGTTSSASPILKPAASTAASLSSVDPLGAGIMLPQRPQPARSPYEWMMKRSPAFAAGGGGGGSPQSPPSSPLGGASSLVNPMGRAKEGEAEGSKLL